MYAGMIIEYTVRPVLGIPLHWVTEITHVQEPEYFVDEQRFGPYALWHHKHFIRPVEGGWKWKMWCITNCRWAGWVNWHICFFVKRQLRQIFDFREKLAELFGQSLRV